MLLRALFFIFFATAAAAEPVIVASQYGAGRPQTLFWERFAELLDAEAPGEFDVRIVTGGALGGEKEEAEAIRLGALQGALSTVANLTTWVPEGAALDLPFVFSGPAHIEQALAGPLGEQLRAAYRAQGFHVPAFIVFGARHIIGSNGFETPSDLDAVTVRSLQSDLHIAMWRALGANPTALPITEAYTALSNGVVDAMDMTMSGYDALKLHEAAPVLSETAHIWAIGVVYFGADFFDGLAKEQQALFDRAATTAAAYFNDLAAAEQMRAMTNAQDAGAQRIAVDHEAWRTALLPFVNAYIAAQDNPKLAAAVAQIQEATP